MFVFVVNQKPRELTNLEIIKETYKEYIGPKYVYKKCYDKTYPYPIEPYDVANRVWLVILEKLDDTQTNEKRNFVVDHRYAKFRCNKLKVVKIINVNDPERTKYKIVNVYDGIRTSYEVGSIVTPDNYDEDIDKVCSGGIHYFKTIDPAYFYDKIPVSYTGLANWWDDNGRYVESGECVKGEYHGKWTVWNRYGKKLGNGFYTFGKKSGLWTYWHSNGVKAEEGYYKKDEMIGIWYRRNEQGKLI